MLFFFFKSDHRFMCFFFNKIIQLKCNRVNTNIWNKNRQKNNKYLIIIMKLKLLLNQRKRNAFITNNTREFYTINIIIKIVRVITLTFRTELISYMLFELILLCFFGIRCISQCSVQCLDFRDQWYRYNLW